MAKITQSFQYGSHTVTLETGEIARQASGACLASMGDTVVLVTVVAQREPMPQDTKMGHFHLYVANLDATMRFYHDLLGFDDMGLARSFRMGMVSAGGYHHHVGFNTWVGEGAPPPPPDALGLRYFSFILPNKTELERVVERVQRAGIATEPTEEGILVRDPSENCVVLSDRSRSSKQDGSLA